MKRFLLIACVIGIVLSVARAQEPTLTGTEELFSRSHEGLAGPVRTLLSVSKRPHGLSSKTFTTATYTFDPTGALTGYLNHYADVEVHSGKLVSLDFSRSYVYDTNKKVIRAVYYAPNGSVTGRDEYRYDASGRLTEIINYTQDGTISEKSLFSYEPTKRQTTVTWLTYRGAPSTNYFVYTFDSKGRKIERTTLNEDRSLNHRIAYSHDESGNLSKEEHYDEGNKYRWGHIYTYKLDAKGNWFEREDMYTQSDRKPSLDMVTYRVITYYGQDQ